MKLLVFLLIFLVLNSGCTTNPQQENNLAEEQDSPELQAVIDVCNSLCNIDSDAYCEEQRTIIVNNVEVKGTCRAFARQENVIGFTRCTGFCNSYPKSTNKCMVNGELDEDCNGII